MRKGKKFSMYFRPSEMDFVKAFSKGRYTIDEEGKLLVARMTTADYEALERNECNGKKRIFIDGIPTGILKFDQHHGQTYAYVHLYFHPVHDKGIRITPFSRAVQAHVYHKETSDYRTGMHRVEFMHYNPFGDEMAQRVDPIEDAFDTYGFWLKDPNPIIFTTPRTEDLRKATIEGNVR